MVSLGLSRRLSYPHTTRHVPTLPAVRLTCFAEEFVLVLAHELRHADQIAKGAFLKDDWFAAEEDAERFALMVLDAFWRAWEMAA